MARNASGAYSAVMNQIDLIQVLTDRSIRRKQTPTAHRKFRPLVVVGTRTQGTTSPSIRIQVPQDRRRRDIITTTVTDISSTYNNGTVTFPLTMYTGSRHGQLQLPGKELHLFHEYCDPLHLRRMRRATEAGYTLHRTCLRRCHPSVSWGYVSTPVLNCRDHSRGQEHRHEHSASTGPD